MRDVETDYFFLVANGVDAITALKMLSLVYEKEKTRV